jgi:hypothetical protein
MKISHFYVKGRFRYSFYDAAGESFVDADTGRTGQAYRYDRIQLEFTFYKECPINLYHSVGALVVGSTMIMACWSIKRKYLISSSPKLSWHGLIRQWAQSKRWLH